VVFSAKRRHCELRWPGLKSPKLGCATNNISQSLRSGRMLELARLQFSRAFAPSLGADESLSGKKGRIINMTSIAGKLGQPFAGAYVASKFAI
jgi:NAD(P)-dependent dehydrogenase (short-subunit alcohol dehydrogenase family)